jgi:hypothetical protein
MIGRATHQTAGTSHGVGLAALVSGPVIAIATTPA